MASDTVKNMRLMENLYLKAKDPACSIEEASEARRKAESLRKELGLFRAKKEKVFLQGFYAKQPPEKAPPWVKFALTIKKDEFIKWLYEQEGDWVNAQICQSNSTGKWYAEVDLWNRKKDV